MQPSQLKPLRGFTVGVATELFGIALAIFGLTVPYSTGGPAVNGSPVVSGLGAIVALLGLIMHIVRV